MSDITSKYLEYFKKLETKLRKIAGSASDTSSFRDILRLAKQRNPLIQFKADLIEDLYGLRNVFAHKDRDKYIAEVNQLAFNSIDEILKLIESPPQVGNIFKKKVYSVDTNNITEIVLREMQKNLYTHVPVYDNGKFIGVLTETTVLEWLVENIKEGQAQFYKQTISRINRKYLNSPNNLYRFVPPNLNIFETFKMFEETIEQNKRLGVIFITENGGKNGKLIGIITAWDLPKIKEYLK